MQKIKAFTLLEVTVAMLLSAICIGICYTAFTLMNQYYGELKNRKDSIGNQLLINQLVSSDFDRAFKIEKLDSNINCSCDSGTISYKFSNSYVTRNQYGLKTDTLRIGVRDLTISYQDSLLADSLIKEIILTCQQKNKFVTMHFFKEYSSVNLFN